MSTDPSSRAEEWRNRTIVRALYYYDRTLITRMKRSTKPGARAGAAMERGDVQEAAAHVLRQLPIDEGTLPYRKYFEVKEEEPAPAGQQG